MSVCVVYNPYNFRAKAVVVEIPSNANKYYALALAKKMRKENPMYTEVSCNVNVIGSPEVANYVAFTKRLLKYVPVAIADDANKLLQYYGTDIIVAPLEKVIFRTFEELLSAL